MTRLTAPELECEPMTVLVGDALCVEGDCDHDHDGDHCADVREELACAAHSRTQMAGWFEEIVHGEPWPCQHQKGGVS
ncbi:hypothetical protein [Streptomyces bugieae]|uniref:Uncharacterized protein n=1 Tax=Streptomyces bugieae TaxID=3098223 RepID=A0ABU7NMP0_9ACTN|nr:hypothetical protein [Streptomyces sp. DSM 41528]